MCIFLYKNITSFMKIYRVLFICIYFFNFKTFLHVFCLFCFQLNLIPVSEKLTKCITNNIMELKYKYIKYMMKYDKLYDRA